jgi:hypothetical protein
MSRLIAIRHEVWAGLARNLCEEVPPRVLWKQNYSRADTLYAHFVGVKAEFLGQPNGLAGPVLEYFGGRGHQ